MNICTGKQINSEPQYSVLLALLDHWHSVTELNRILTIAGHSAEAAKVLAALKRQGWKFREVEQEVQGTHPLPAVVKRYRISLWQKSKAHACLRYWRNRQAQAMTAS